MAEQSNYLSRAQRRQRRANAERSTTHAPSTPPLFRAKSVPTDRPYSKRRPVPQPAIAAAAASAAVMVTAPIPAPVLRPRRPKDANEPLADGLSRIQRAQEQAKRTPQQRKTRRPRSRRFYTLTSLPLVLLLIAGVFLGPPLYQAVTAYRDVFVDQPESQPENPIAMVNAEGTAVLGDVSEAPEELPEWDGKDRVTLLLLGVDKRPDDYARSDTMILVNIDPATKTASMMSIPRDLKVFIPGYGVEKMNAAYALGDEREQDSGGGPGLTMRTIKANFGIDINYYAQVDFQGFVKIVDTLGGVTIDVPYPLKDDAYPASGHNYMRIYFPAGWQYMNGERALQYARTRHADGDGHRSRRQQEVLMALREQAISLDLLPKANDLLSQFGDSIRTSLSLTQLLQLARLGSEISADSIKSYSLESALYADDSTGIYYLVPDWDMMADTLSEFAGKQIVPPGSVLANPDTSMPIRIYNAAGNPGLAGRVAEQLQVNGYENIYIAEEGTAEYQDFTTITVSSDDLATSFHVAAVIGVGIDAIDMTAPPPTPTPEPTATPTVTAVPARGSPSPGASPALSPEATVSPEPQAQADTRTPEEGGIVLVLGYDTPDPQYFAPVDEGEGG